MKLLDRYILSEVVKAGLVALLIFSLLVMAVETFINIDKFVSNSLPFTMMMKYSFYALSDYFLMITGVSMLFSVTYFLSNLSANNELISLYTAGYSRVRILMPIVLLALVLTASFTCFNESLFLEWKNGKDVVSTELFGLSGTQDARNVALNDVASGYLVFSRSFSEGDERLYEPIVMKSFDDRLVLRLEAERGDYRDGEWVFRNAIVYELGEDGFVSKEYDETTLQSFDFPPSLFRSRNMQIDTMEMSSALEYLSRLKGVDPTSWQEKETEFLRRVGEPLGILVLMLISVLMNYTFKKNILLFSIVQSLVIAVVYYVSDMVFSIVCKQGMLAPAFVVVLPLFFTVFLSIAISYIGKRI